MSTLQFAISGPDLPDAGTDGHASAPGTAPGARETPPAPRRRTAVLGVVTIAVAALVGLGSEVPGTDRVPVVVPAAQTLELPLAPIHGRALMDGRAERGPVQVTAESARPDRLVPRQWLPDDVLAVQAVTVTVRPSAGEVLTTRVVLPSLVSEEFGAGEPEVVLATEQFDAVDLAGTPTPPWPLCMVRADPARTETLWRSVAGDAEVTFRLVAEPGTDGWVVRARVSARVVLDDRASENCQLEQISQEWR